MEGTEAMITNERQYKITKTQAEKFRSAIEDFDVDQTIKGGLHPMIARAQLEQLESEYSNLIEQLEEYDALIEGTQKEFEAESIHDLPVMLIKARIARNWTQKELAIALGIKEQQLQRYESDLYRSANLKTLSRVAETIGLRVSESAVLYSPDDPVVPSFSEGFPLPEMLKRGWFEDFGGTLAQAKRNAPQLIEQFYLSARVDRNLLAMHRKMVRGGGVLNEAALSAWQVRAIHIANKQKLRQQFDSDRLTFDWFRELAKLSQYDEGPLLARDWLLESGIHFVVERHLPQTHLDGAALRHPGGTPIVAVTLRHDRLDNFWFVLFHELAHIALHFPLSDDTDYFDDIDVKCNDIESEADTFALNALLPEESWENCLSRFSLTTEMVQEEAKQLRVHPSVLAGRIRYERNNYTILNDAVGYGEVRRHFENRLN